MSNTDSGRTDQPEAIAAHFERSISTVTGEEIFLECECPIGEDHTYADWLSHFTRAAF